MRDMPYTTVSLQKGQGHYTDPDAVRDLVWGAIDELRLPDDFLRPGDHVVLKPNWLGECDVRFRGPGHWEHLITHPYVIESVCGWVVPRLVGSGKITICDCPQTDSSFDRIREYCQLDDMIHRLSSSHPEIEFRLVDLRPEEWQSLDGVVVKKRLLPGDPAGHVDVSLDKQSFFVGFHGLGRLFGASYDMDETNARHHDTTHQYRLCRTPMDADVLINIPKLKTHKKVGITCALKNIVGINGDKNWLPHYTEGTPGQGGDQFPSDDLRSRTETRWMGFSKRIVNRMPALGRVFVPVKKVGRWIFGDTLRVVRSGNWHGNDTCWRMVLDLNLCLFGFASDGAERRTPLRYLSVIDGIVSGEGDGPWAPDPVRCGVVVAGTHPVAVDAVSALLMGFDPLRLSMIRHALDLEMGRLPAVSMNDIQIVSNQRDWNGEPGSFRGGFRFRPHFGWTGFIEAANGGDES